MSPLRHLLHQIRVPSDLDAVSSIDHQREKDPTSVGLDRGVIDAIWDGVRDVYRSGMHPAITICLRRHGKIVMARAIGHSHGNGPDDPADTPRQLASVNTPFCLYSGSKGITAVLVHMLAEDGLVNLMDPVCFYAPEFARKGKHNITIHQILAHRGGIPGLAPDTSSDNLLDEERIWEMLCDAEPIITDGSRLAYHAITGGFVLERVMRTVTGGSFNDYIDRKIRQPMAFDNFSYGMPEERLSELTPTYGTGPRPGPLLTVFIKRALGVEYPALIKLANDDAFQQAIIPAGNLISNAVEASAFYQMMLNDGKWGRRRICQPSTVARAVQEFGTRTVDRTLGVPLRYSAGLMLGDEPFGVYGPHSRHAYGHVGMINKFCWADPSRALSAAILTNGIPVLGPHLPPLIKLLGTIGNGIPPDQDVTPFAL